MHILSHSCVKWHRKKRLHRLLTVMMMFLVTGEHDRGCKGILQRNKTAGSGDKTAAGSSNL